LTKDEATVFALDGLPHATRPGNSYYCPTTVVEKGLAMDMIELQHLAMEIDGLGDDVAIVTSWHVSSDTIYGSKSFAKGGLSTNLGLRKIFGKFRLVTRCEHASHINKTFHESGKDGLKMMGSAFLLSALGAKALRSGKPVNEATARTVTASAPACDVDEAAMRRIAHNNCVANGAKGWALVCSALEINNAGEELTDQQKIYVTNYENFEENIGRYQSVPSFVEFYTNFFRYLREWLHQAVRPAGQQPQQRRAQAHSGGAAEAATFRAWSVQSARGAGLQLQERPR
jgi:hypothetical protein